MNGNCVAARRAVSVIVFAMFAATSAGCTVIGGAVGTLFNSPPEEHSSEFLGPELVGSFVQVVDSTGVTHKGTMAGLEPETLILTHGEDIFGTAEPETLRRENVRSVALGKGWEGTDRGMTLGATVDAVVVLWLIAVLSHLSFE